MTKLGKTATAAQKEADKPNVVKRLTTWITTVKTFPKTDANTERMAKLQAYLDELKGINSQPVFERPRTKKKKTVEVEVDE